MASEKALRRESGGKDDVLLHFTTKEMPKQHARQGLLFLVLRDRMKAINLNLTNIRKMKEVANE